MTQFKLSSIRGQTPKNWSRFVKLRYEVVKLSPRIALIIDLCVCLSLTMKISLRARENFCSYRKKLDFIGFLNVQPFVLI